MAQITAGEVIQFNVHGVSITAKIEDASKGDVFSAKVQSVSENTTYHVDGVYEFNRNVL